MWSPFDRHGNLRLVFVDDPWWKRLWAKARGDKVWTRLGAYVDDAGEEDMPPLNKGE